MAPRYAVRPRRPWRLVAALTTAGLVVAAGSAASTYSLWAAETSLSDQIVSGVLNLAVQTPPTFTLNGLPSTFDAQLAGGDTMVITEPLTVTLRGTNMKANFGLTWDVAPVVPAGTKANWTLVGPDGQAKLVGVAGVPQVVALTASEGETWTLVLTAVYDPAKPDVWVATPAGVTTEKVDFGSISVNLSQVGM